MSRASQIRFLSHTAPFYDAVVRALGFAGLWSSVAECANPAPGAPCLDVCTGTGGVALGLAARGAQVVAEYRVPASCWRRAAFRIGRAFEFLESDDFGSFLARPMSERLEAAGLRVEAVTNAGFYRIWNCRVDV